MARCCRMRCHGRASPVVAVVAHMSTTHMPIRNRRTCNPCWHPLLAAVPTHSAGACSRPAACCCGRGASRPGRTTSPQHRPVCVTRGPTMTGVRVCSGCVGYQQPGHPCHTWLRVPRMQARRWCGIRSASAVTMAPCYAHLHRPRSRGSRALACGRQLTLQLVHLGLKVSYLLGGIHVAEGRQGHLLLGAGATHFVRLKARVVVLVVMGMVLSYELRGVVWSEMRRCDRSGWLPPE